MIDDIEILEFSTAKAWLAWLAKNHKTSPGIWLRFARKHSKIPSIVYQEALDGALRYGWIDAVMKSEEGDYYRQRFLPRAPRSKWSKINCNKAEVLIAEGKMKAAGLAAVEAAKQDGRWDAAVPRDLPYESLTCSRARTKRAHTDNRCP